jgi:agmatinase
VDENSSFLRGSAEAPQAIIDSLYSDSTNLCTENGINLEEDHRFKVLGVMDVGHGSRSFKEIEKIIKQLVELKVNPISLGGDHSITYPILTGFTKHYDPLNVLQFDAHPDLYDAFDDNPFSHACTFARIMEENLADRLVQVGIRTATPHQRKQARRFGVEAIEMASLPLPTPLDLEGPVYISLDLDVLDPAFAPGVSHHEPGGLTTRQLIRFIQQLKGQVVGADIVELNPSRDPLGITSMVAAKMIKEIASRMLETS